jgi:hypothetical protein
MKIQTLYWGFYTTVQIEVHLAENENQRVVKI